jgi:hypothetical protein
MNGCLKFVAGFLIVGVVVIAALAVGGYFIFQKYAPAIQNGIQALGKAQQEIEKIVPGGGLNINSSTVNGKSTLKLSLKVPFDPSQGNQAQQTANQIAEIIRRNAPSGLSLQNIELHLIHEIKSGGSIKRSERIFKLDLSKPNKPVIKQSALEVRVLRWA